MPGITKFSDLEEEEPHPWAAMIDDLPSEKGKIAFRKATPLLIQKNIYFRPYILNGRPYLVLKFTSGSLSPILNRYAVISLARCTVLKATGGEFTTGVENYTPTIASYRWLPNLHVDEYAPKPVHTRKYSSWKSFQHLSLELEGVPPLKWYGHKAEYFDIVSRNFFNFLDNDPSAKTMDILMLGDSIKRYENVDGFVQLCNQRGGYVAQPLPDHKKMRAAVAEFEKRKKAYETAGTAKRVRKELREYRGPIAPEFEVEESKQSESESEGEGEGSED